MKYILSFLFGVGCGVGGTLLWLRKDIKQELENARQEASTGSELPFTVGNIITGSNQEKAVRSDSEGSERPSRNDIRQNAENRVEYNKMIDEINSGVKPSAPILVHEREEAVDSDSEGSEDDSITLLNDQPDIIRPIDIEEFKYEDKYEKVELVYFSTDRVMATENGCVYPNPAICVGSDWEQYVGRYANREAFIRNERQMTDYDISIEDCTFAEYFGFDPYGNEEENE